MSQLPNILIVDDRTENLFLVEYALRSIDAHLIKALSGAEAIEKIAGLDLALAIIDVQMPGMNGYELVTMMNEDREGDKVPVIFLTANNSNSLDVIKGYSVGAVDYLIKPFPNFILVSKVNTFLEIYNQKKTIRDDAILLKKSAEELSELNLVLKINEEKYRNYIQRAPYGIFVADENGHYLEVNDTACRLSGYSEEQLLQMSIPDILPEESLKSGLDHFKTLVTTGSSKGDILFKRSDGTKWWWNLEAVKLSDTRFLGFAEEITARKLAENALRKSEADLRQSQHIARLCSWELEANSNTLVWSDEVYEIFDIPRDGTPVTSEALENIIHPDDLERFTEVITGDIPPGNLPALEYRIIHRDGTIHYLLAEGQMTVDKDSRPTKGFGTVQDITEFKLAEQAIKLSEEKYKTMLNASPDGILIIDMKGIITEVSGIALELFGAENREDLLKKRILKFIPPSEKFTIRTILEKTINEGLAQDIEIKIRKKNRATFAGEASITLIQGSDGEPLSFMVIVRDISFRKKVETKQIHADRMANLGEMASGIAHEINQPLNIISMVMDKILFEIEKSDKIDIPFLLQKSERIFENITRMRNIIDHIRAFSRSHEDYVLSSFDANVSIQNATSMMIEQLKHLGIELYLHLDNKIPSIIGDTYKFEQVIINLLTNAKDAVLEKKNRTGIAQGMQIEITSFLENQCLIVEVSDNGIGISQEDIHNIMLPFYTTKEEGKGTGLGLSICYQIIKEMDGTIDILNDEKTIIRLVLNIPKEK